jgi:nucleotidyltransferase/DNA polymerase involved in DNA repair
VQAYLDVTECCARRGLGPEELAEEIRRRVREETGGLTASCGIAAVRFVAKIAADVNKPDGQFYVRPDRDELLGFVRPLAIRKIGGIGKVSCAYARTHGDTHARDIVGR